MFKSCLGSRRLLAVALVGFLGTFLAGSFALFGQSRQKTSLNVHDPAVPPRAAQVVKFFEDQGFSLRRNGSYVWKWRTGAGGTGEDAFQGGFFEARSLSPKAGQINKLIVWINAGIEDPGYDDIDNDYWLCPDGNYSRRGHEVGLLDDEFKKYIPVPGRKIGIWVGRIMLDSVAMISCGSVGLEARGAECVYDANGPDAAEKRRKILDYLEMAVGELKGFQGKLCAAGLCRCESGALAIEFLDGNPVFNGKFDFTKPLPGSQWAAWQKDADKKIVAARETRKGVAADGISLLLFRSEVPGPGTAILELKGEANAGALYRIMGGPVNVAPDALTKGASKLTVTPFEDRDGGRTRYWINALYLPPKASKARDVEVEIRFTSALGRESKGSRNLLLVLPPVVLVHGTFDNPEACWNVKDLPEAEKTMSSRLISEGYRVFLTDWGDSSGQKDPSSFNYNRMAVWQNKGGIRDALTQMRSSAIAVTQADVVAHSQGGLIVRMYARGKWETDPSDPSQILPLPMDDPHFTDPRTCAENGCAYHRSDNFGRGDIRRLITISTTHYGSDICRLFKAFAYFVDNRKLIGDPILDVWNGFKTEIILCLHSQREAVICIPILNETLGKWDLGWMVKLKDLLWNKLTFLNDYVFTEAFSNQVPGSPELQSLMKTPIPAHAIACAADANDMLTLNRGYYEQRLELLWSMSSANLLREAFMRLGQDADAEDLYARKIAEQSLIERRNELSSKRAGSRSEPSPEDTRALDELNERLKKSVTLNAERLRSATFGNVENDCTVRASSSLGGLDGKYATVLPHVLHGPAPQFPKVQQKVVELLQDDGTLFNPAGFPMAGMLPPDRTYSGPAAPSSFYAPAPETPGTGRPGIRKGVEKPALPDVPEVTKPAVFETAELTRLNPGGTLDLVFLRCRLLLRGGRITVSASSPWEKGDQMIEPGAILLSVRDLADDRIRPSDNLSLQELARILNSPDQNNMVVLKFAAPGGGNVEVPHPGGFRPPEAPPAGLDGLIRDLGSKTPQVAAEAAAKLGAMGEKSLPAAPELVKLLGSRNDFHYDGLDAQGRMTGGVISPRREAWTALTKIGRAAVPALIDGLMGSDYAVAVAAAELLGGFKDPRAIEPLRKVVSANRAGVSEAAAKALAAIERNK